MPLYGKKGVLRKGTSIDGDDVIRLVNSDFVKKYFV
jgi:hypothetical protein